MVDSRAGAGKQNVDAPAPIRSAPPKAEWPTMPVGAPAREHDLTDAHTHDVGRPQAHPRRHAAPSTSQSGRSGRRLSQYPFSRAKRSR